MRKPALLPLLSLAAALVATACAARLRQDLDTETALLMLANEDLADARAVEQALRDESAFYQDEVQSLRTEVRRLDALAEQQHAALCRARTAGPFLVTRSGGLYPDGPFDDADEAGAHAEGLARMHPEETVTLYAPIYTIEMPAPEPVWTRSTSIPTQENA